jgi:LPXTG-motif cell wall-anchored protein
VDTSNQSNFAAADEAPEAKPVVIAQADPKPIASELPNTAGPLPLIALGGLMSLLGGLGLTLRRKISNRAD